jgi:hypothetical protein
MKEKIDGYKKIIFVRGYLLKMIIMYKEEEDLTRRHGGHGDHGGINF